MLVQYVFFFLFGTVYTASYKWDGNSIFRKRDQPPEAFFEHNDCDNIYSCLTTEVRSPGGSREHGFTFTMANVADTCNYATAFRRCYNESEFYQSCDDLTQRKPRWDALSYFCTDSGKKAASTILPCVNKKSVQDEVTSMFNRINKKYSFEKYNVCHYVAEVAGSVLITIFDFCNMEDFRAALNIHYNVGFDNLMGLDMSDC